MPHVCYQLDLPLALATHEPLQVRVARSALAIDPAVLQFCEVALEERNLVLIGRAGHVGCAPLDAEVVVHLAAGDGSLGLRNELRTPHVAVPLCGVVDGDLGSLLAARIGRVLVGRREVDVVRYCAVPVDVVLVWSDLVCP